MIVATPENFQLPAIQGIVGPERRYKLLDDYRVEWEEKGVRYARTVYMMDQDCGCPTETDLASVPPPAGIAGHTTGGPSDGAAVIHDDDYKRLGRKDGQGFKPGQFQVLIEGEWIDCTEKYDRSRSDWRYFKNCMLGGMGRLKAFREYLALRVGAVNRKNKWGWYFS